MLALPGCSCVQEQVPLIVLRVPDRSEGDTCCSHEGNARHEAVHHLGACLAVALVEVHDRDKRHAKPACHLGQGRQHGTDGLVIMGVNVLAHVGAGRINHDRYYVTDLLDLRFEQEQSLHIERAPSFLIRAPDSLNQMNLSAVSAGSN